MIFVLKDSTKKVELAQVFLLNDFKDTWFLHRMPSSLKSQCDSGMKF